MRELPEMPRGDDKDVLGSIPRLVAHLDWKLGLESKGASLGMNVVFCQGYLVGRKVAISDEDAKKIEEILLPRYLGESTKEEVTAI